MRPSSTLRLGSSVVRVRHEGAPASAAEAVVTYLRDGRAFAVRARHCVLACYNMMSPYLAPELPETTLFGVATEVADPRRFGVAVVDEQRRGVEQVGVLKTGDVPADEVSGLTRLLAALAFGAGDVKGVQRIDAQHPADD